MRLAALAVLLGCGTPAEKPAVVVHLGDVVDTAGEGQVTLPVEVDGEREVQIFLDGQPRVVELAVGASPEIETRWLDETRGGSGWFMPRPLVAPEENDLLLTGDGAAEVTLWVRGAPAPSAVRLRSLVWTDPTLLDDPRVVGLGRLMAAISSDGHGGRMLDGWFRRFATTAHSERAAPAQLMDEIAVAQGSDPSSWNLDALPFTVTAVHNRLDLAPRDGGCGQLRVSLASVHPTYAPFHMIFLFRQRPAVDDVAPDGTIHCRGTARRWARLGELDDASFRDAARAILAATLTREDFLLAETVELTVSPWEWRQWKLVAPDTLDNPPLFETADVARLNSAGALRDRFLAFVAGNAAGLDGRTLAIPEEFRAPSARVPPSAPREPLDLTGLDADVAAAYPRLREHVEIVGCPTCHTTNADFVQTSPQRVFSPFYDRELDARAVRLDLMNAGAPVPTPPFGPLQPEE